MKKMLALALCALMMLTVVTGCSSEKNNSSGTPDSSASINSQAAEVVSGNTGDDSLLDTESEITIRGIISDLDDHYFFTDIANAYTQAYPNVTFELEGILGDEYVEKATVMLAGGDDVDLIYNKNMAQYMSQVNNEQVISLSDLIERDNVDLSIYNGAAERITLGDGNIYGLPFRSDYWVVYYNKTMFDELNVEYPPDDWTWEEYAEMCAELTHTDENGNHIYGANFTNWTAPVWNLAFQTGEHTVVAKDYSFMKDAYELVFGMQENGYIMDYATIQTNNITYLPAFYAEECATVYNGTWAIPRIVEQEASEEGLNFEWGVACAPHTSDGEFGQVIGTTFTMSINSKSENVEHCWNYIKILCSPEGGAYVVDTGFIAACMNDELTEQFKNAEGMGTLGDIFNVKQLSFEQEVHDLTSSLVNVLEEEHQMIMTGNETIDEGIANMTERVQPLWEEYEAQ